MGVSRLHYEKKLVMDTIFLRKIALYTFVGYYDWERLQPTKLQIDLDIGLPVSYRPCTDDITQTIDYARLIQDLRKALSTKHFALIEPLAEYIAQFILENFLVPWVKVSLTKLGTLPDNGKVGVVIERNCRS